MSYEPPAHGFRTFLILWFTQSISVFGSSLTLFAVIIWLTLVQFPGADQRRELALAISAVSIAHSLPIVFIAPLAGAWADRHDRKRTMLVMDFFNGCLSFLLVLLVLTDGLNLPVLLVIITLASCCSSFHFASFDSSYAMIVPEKQLPRANSMMQTASDLSNVIAPALAAGIISAFKNGMPLAIAADAVTFFLASATLIFLSIPSPKRNDLTPSVAAAKSKGVREDIMEGAGFIMRRRPLVWLLVSFTIANLLGSPIFVFQPLIVKYNLAADWAAHGLTFEKALALMNSLASLGGVVGGVIVSAWGGLTTRRIFGVLIPLVLAAAAEIVFGLSSMLYLTVTMIFVISFMIAVMNAHTRAIWQAQTPRELQGRVFSVRRLISQFTWPISTAAAGWIGGFFNPGLALAVMGSLFFAFSLGQLFNRTLLAVDAKVALPELIGAGK